REAAAMRSGYSTNFNVKQTITNVQLKTKTTLNKFLEARKKTTRVLDVTHATPVAPPPSTEEKKTTVVTLKTITEKCDFAALLQGMRTLSTRGVYQMMPGYVDMSATVN